jgi:hypothetical protein
LRHFHAATDIQGYRLDCENRAVFSIKNTLT